MREAIIIIFGCMFLLIMSVQIAQKEDIRNDGYSIFFALAPTDPRSLMQGDFMRLGYHITQNLKAPNNASRGTLVIRENANREAEFVGFYDPDADYTPQDRIIHYRNRDDRITLFPDSFFFQEGHATHFENAAFAIFKFNDKGEYLLVGLADADKKRIVAD